MRTTASYTLSLHDALPISIRDLAERVKELTESESEITLVPYEDVYGEEFEDMPRRVPSLDKIHAAIGFEPRSEEHTSELQSHSDLVCRLLLEKKKKQMNAT